MLTAIYFIMPVGRLSLRHAMIGGVTATILWELMRHILAWYYTTMYAAGGEVFPATKSQIDASRSSSPSLSSQRMTKNTLPSLRSSARSISAI